MYAFSCDFSQSMGKYNFSLKIHSLCLIFLLIPISLFYLITLILLPSYDRNTIHYHPPIINITKVVQPPPKPIFNITKLVQPPPKPQLVNPNKTQLHHIVFGVAASAGLWNHRKEYIKLWWRPEAMRGYVWLDKPVNYTKDDRKTLPPVKISGDTSRFKYTHEKGHRSAIRLSRIVSEMKRMRMADVRWFVMGDDDTFFVADNLVRVLEKYDHRQFHYIGSSSESHLQNIRFSYGMAYGGGGIAISFALAEALEKMQDGCIKRYPALYGSDDRLQACMAELGVPFTKEIGFHQFDIYGNAYGLLAAHPVAPLISMHHLDLIDPIFPKLDQIKSLQHLKIALKLDSAALMQQSICYDKVRKWTISVSWGYTVQIFRSMHSVREIERPSRTFDNWYRGSGYIGFPFNTRSVENIHPCDLFVFMMSNTSYNPAMNQTVSEYVRNWGVNRRCNPKILRSFRVIRVEVYKKPDPHVWEKARRRNCCRTMPSKKRNTVVIQVGQCQESEVISL